MSGLLIIGAGPAGLGLSAAYDGPSRIVEQEREVGGLCRSFEFGGAVFDLGGHSFHTPYADVAVLVEDVMQARWEHQRRDARVWFDGGLIDYPFQAHLDQIANPAIAEECRRTMPAMMPDGPEALNFEEWIVRRFGAGVGGHFMLPYNRKLWARDLGRMSSDWVGERIAGAGPAGPGRAPLLPQTQVGYPADGGFVEICRGLARRAGPIDFGERIAAIDTSARQARAASGRTYGWDTLVSTMPLPALLRCLPDCPPDLIRDVDRLEAVALKVVMISAERSPGRRPQRIYCAGPEIPAHKIAFNHESSRSLRRRPREAVMCEVSYSHTKAAPDASELEAAMLGWLRDTGMIGRGPAEVRTVDVPLAYPVPTPDRAGIVARARAWLAPWGIFTIGRFGAWTYANSDACLKEGMDLAAYLRAV